MKFKSKSLIFYAPYSLRKPTEKKEQDAPVLFACLMSEPNQNLNRLLHEAKRKLNVYACIFDCRKSNNFNVSCKELIKTLEKMSISWRTQKKNIYRKQRMQMNTRYEHFANEIA